MSKIPQTSPGAAFREHRDEIERVIAEVLESGWYLMGENVKRFEEELAAFLGVRHVISVGSGTDALSIALRACGVSSDDEVVTVSHTGVATVAAIEIAGARPLLVDVDPDTMTIDPAQVARALDRQPAPKVIIPVHLYGRPADMDALVALARGSNAIILEDCAQSHGAMLGSRMTGTFGRVSAFSFYPTKNLGALGDGGAIATDDPEIADRARLLREYGWRERYVSAIPGQNSRLDELQAAILRVRLRYLHRDNTRRREIARIYDERLPFGPLLTLPSPHPGHVFHQYVVRSPFRDELRDYLASRDILTLVHYPVPVHLQPAYSNRIEIVGGTLPNTERLAREVLSLPMYPQLTDADIELITRTTQEWISKRAVA